MIRMNNDFYSNFMSSAKAVDDKALLDLLADEISTIVVFKKKELYSIFKRLNIVVDENKVTTEELADLVIDKIQTHKGMVVAISFLLASNNNLTYDIAKKKARKPQKPSEKSGKVSSDVVEKLSKVIKPFIDTLKSNKDRKTAFRNSLIQKIRGKENRVKYSEEKTSAISSTDVSMTAEDIKKKKRKKIIKYSVYTAIGIGVVVGGFFLYKHLKKKGVFASGGAVDGGSSATPDGGSAIASEGGAVVPDLASGGLADSATDAAIDAV